MSQPCHGEHSRRLPCHAGARQQVFVSRLMLSRRIWLFNPVVQSTCTEGTARCVRKMRSLWPGEVGDSNGLSRSAEREKS